MDPDDQDDPIAERMLDGNVLGGALSAAFGAEMTAVPSKCAHCGAVNVVGSLRAYVDAPGAILRCPICGGIVIRVVETTEATYIDAQGAAYLRFKRS